MRRVLAVAAVLTWTLALPGAASALPAGSFDTSFGGTGVITPDVISGAEDAPYAAVVDSQGRIVEVDGQSPTCLGPPLCLTADVNIARFNPDGTPDMSFGSNGVRLVAHTPATTYTAVGIGLQSDGRIIVAYGNKTGNLWDVRRFDSAGNPDPGFGTGSGKFEKSGLGPLAGMGLDGDQILLAGTNAGANKQEVIRLTKDGVPDPGWGGGNPVEIDYGVASQAATSVGALPDHKVYVLGITGPTVATTVTRLDAAGAPDSGFSGDGKLTLPSFPAGSIFLPAQQIAVGTDGITFGGTLRDVTNTTMIVTKLTAAGVPDVNFSADGEVSRVLGTGVTPVSVSGVLAQPNGSVLVGGASGSIGPLPSLSGFVDRYTAAGEIDNSFSGDGDVTIPGATPIDVPQVNWVAQAPDGRVAVVGTDTSILGPHSTSLLARVLTAADNCPAVLNADQADLDGDGLGDACDDDIDGDGLSNTVEAAIGSNPRSTDSDGDGKLDGADACPTLAGTQANGCPVPERVTSEPVQPTATPADKTPAKLGFTIAKTIKRATFLKKGLSFKLASNEPVKVEAQLIGTLKGARVARAGDVIIAEKNLGLGGGSRTIKFKLGKKQKKLIGKTAKLTVRVPAFDAAGNRTVASKTIKVK